MASVQLVIMTPKIEISGKKLSRNFITKRKTPMISTKKTSTARKNTNLKIPSVDLLLICFFFRLATLSRVLETAPAN